MTGAVQHAYVADETPMVSYLNLHHALDKLRVQAQTTGQTGPRVRLAPTAVPMPGQPPRNATAPRFFSWESIQVVVAGPTDVGKSTLCRILLSYAVRGRRQPIFVDLDVGQVRPVLFHAASLKSPCADPPVPRARAGLAC